jgi:hypothetical protein
MVFLQKVRFCNFIRNNPRLFSACQRKKIVIAVASFMNFDFKLIDLVMREAFCKLKKARKYFFNLVNLFYNHKMLEYF